MPPHSTVYGAAPSVLRFCPKCFPTPSVGLPNHSPGQHARYSWAIELVCPSCMCKYTLCTACPGQRSRLTNRTLLQRHNSRFHVVRPTPPPLPSHVGDASSSSVSCLNTESSSLNSGCTLTPFQFQDPSHNIVTFSTKQSTLYFQHHINDGSGPYFLASKSIFKIDHTYTALTDDDVSLNLLLGHLVILLPDKPRKMLCQLIKTILARTTAPPPFLFLTTSRHFNQATVPYLITPIQLH
jgi:hypothetical protein